MSGGEEKRGPPPAIPSRNENVKAPPPLPDRESDEDMDEGIFFLFCFCFCFFVSFIFIAFLYLTLPSFSPPQKKISLSIPKDQQNPLSFYPEMKKVNSPLKWKMD